MQTIQIEVSEQLAQKLQPYQGELPEVLEAGLQVVTRKAQRHQQATQSEIRHILSASGKVYIPSQQQTDAPSHTRHTPVEISGQPVSEIIQEQRN